MSESLRYIPAVLFKTGLPGQLPVWQHGLGGDDDGDGDGDLSTGVVLGRQSPSIQCPSIYGRR